VENTFVPLGKVGIHGNGHFLQLEKNTSKLLDSPPTGLSVMWARKLDGSRLFTFALIFSAFILYDASGSSLGRPLIFAFLLLRYL